MLKNLFQIDRDVNKFLVYRIFLIIVFWILYSFIVMPLSVNASSFTNKSINIISIKANESGITLKWNKESTCKGYIILRSEDGRKYCKIDNVSDNVYTDSNVELGIAYSYAIKGFKFVKGKKIYTEINKTKQIYLHPKKIEGVKAEYIGCDTVKLSWKKNMEISGYYIYRSFDKKKWTKVATLFSELKSSYNDSVNQKQKYCSYKIIPFININGRIIRGVSNCKCVTARSVKGIDVSHHNGRIDWEKVKQAGVDFAFIRCGYGDASVAEDGVVDRQFARNVREARKYNIDIGIYVYSTATSVSDAKNEAKFVINTIKKYGKFKYPIVYDFESEYRKHYKYKSENTEMILAFFQTLEKAGYDNLVLYSDFGMLYRYTKYKVISKKYGLWMAWWTYDYDCYPTDLLDNVMFWQYSDSGHIDGITEAVDLNVRYVSEN